MAKTTKKPQPDGQYKHNKTRRSSEMKVGVHWQHTEEISPAFKRLMVLLLQPLDNQRIETLWPEEEPQNEQ